MLSPRAPICFTKIQKYSMSNKIPDFQKIGEQLIKDAQTIAEVEMINFVMGNFEKQGFTDKSLTPWEKRKDNADPGRAVLVKSGMLRDSVKVTESNPDRVVVSASAKYAQIHNEGGIINVRVTPRMRKYFWLMYYKTEDEKYRAMALTKKQAFKIKIPKRQFMGHSENFNAHIEDLFFKTITQRFKQHLNTI